MDVIIMKFNDCVRDYFKIREIDKYIIRFARDLLILNLRSA